MSKKITKKELIKTLAKYYELSHITGGEYDDALVEAAEAACGYFDKEIEAFITNR